MPHDETGKLPRESDHAKQHRRTCQPVHEPAGGRQRDPASYQRNDLPAEKQPVVAILERTQHECDA